MKRNRRYESLCGIRCPKYMREPISIPIAIPISIAVLLFQHPPTAAAPLVCRKRRRDKRAGLFTVFIVCPFMLLSIISCNDFTPLQAAKIPCSKAAICSAASHPLAGGANGTVGASCGTTTTTPTSHSSSWPSSAGPASAVRQWSSRARSDGGRGTRLGGRDWTKQ